VNDDAGDVDDGDAERYAADARAPLNAHVLLAVTATHVRRTTVPHTRVGVRNYHREVGLDHTWASLCPPSCP